MWASVLTNQYLNPEPKYMFRLYCRDEKGRDSLEKLAVITEQKGALWESYAEERSYALSRLTDWDTLVPKDPCNPDDRFLLRESWSLKARYILSNLIFSVGNGIMSSDT